MLALVLGAAVALGACSAEDDAGAARGPGWVGNGQTGSLMPLCGLPPGALMRGVPASAAGLVLDPSECADPSVFGDLAIRDASGREVGFTVTELPDGTLLVSFVNGLTPGSYTVGIAVPFPDDEDGGVDAPPLDYDAGIGMQPMVRGVIIEESAPMPTHFGEVMRAGGECGAVLELAPESSVVPYLGVLAVDLQIDNGAVQELVPVGTLQLMNGVARINLLEHGFGSLWSGEHELRVTVRLAGQSMPLETFLLTVQVPCDSGDAYDDSSEPGICAVSAVGSSPTSAAPLVFVTLYALRRRRRRMRE